MSTLLHPKLARELARPRLEALRQLTPTELSAEAQILLPGHTFDPIGGRQVTEGEIASLRSEALQVAHECGYPDTPGIEQRVRFDGRMGRLLHERMSITPHQGAEEEIWTHLTVGALVDIAAWRFGGLRDERALGRGARSTFRRLWWRAEILGAVSWDETRPLNEDETVQIMERPELAGSPLVAQALVDAFHRRVEASPSAGRMNLMRDALKRTYRLTPFLRMETLSPTALLELLDELFLESARSMVDGTTPFAACPPALDAWDAGASYRADAVELSGDASPQREEEVTDPRADPAPVAAHPVETARPVTIVDEVADEGPVADETPGSSSFDHLPIGVMMQRLAEAIRQHGPVEDGDLIRVVRESVGVEVPPRRRRLLNKLAWSARSRGLVTLDEDSGVWAPGERAPMADDRFGDWSFADLVARAEELLAADPDPFARLVSEVVGESRGPRIVASFVGTAINEAKRDRRTVRR